MRSDQLSYPAICLKSEGKGNRKFRKCKIFFVFFREEVYFSLSRWTFPTISTPFSLYDSLPIVTFLNSTPKIP